MSEQIPSLIIAGCGKKKRGEEAPARELYTGSLASVRLAVVARRAEELGIPWRILSAEHGLVHPDTILEPYDTALSDLRPAARRCWAGRVRELLEELVDPGGLIEIHAGAVYRRALHTYRWEWHVPMRGLGIGEQIGRYRDCLRAWEGER